MECNALRLEENEQLKVLNKEQSENLEKEKENVTQSEEVNHELSVGLSTPPKNFLSPLFCQNLTFG